MSLSLFLLPTLLLALGAHSYALPNPQAAAITPAPATPATPAKLPASTPNTDDYYLDSAELVSQSKEYFSLTREFYATAKPSNIAALNSDRAEWAALTSDLYRTLDPAELAAQSREYVSATAEFYRTAKPSDIAALNSDRAEWAALTADLYATPDPAAESRQYASATAEFYATAKPSDIAALNSDRAEWAALTSDIYETVDPVSESRAWASATAEFYATAKPSDIAALQSERKAVSDEWAAWTADLYRTPTPEEQASLSADWREYTAERAVWQTYNGTGSPFTAYNVSATATATATATVPAQISATAAVVSATAAAEAFPPLQRSQSAPAADAFTCLDSSASEMSDHTLVFSDCDATITAICDKLTGDVANRVAGQWAWSSGGGGKCAMGYWLPAIGDAVPSSSECQANIFDRMRRTCIPVNSQGGRWNAASVNIAVVPSADSAGQQVDATKLSFLMSGSPYRCGPPGCKMLDYA